MATKIGMNIIENFQKIGNELFFLGLNNSHSGNMSVKVSATHLLITKTGAMLHRLSKKDLVKISIYEDDLNSYKASRELPVHRLIYKNTSFKAVVHAHPPYVIALSLIYGIIQPIDAEGKFYFKCGIKSIELNNTIGSDEVASAVVENLVYAPIVIIRSHGVFAAGETLEEAYHWISSFEHSCKILYLHNMYKLSVNSDIQNKIL